MEIWRRLTVAVLVLSASFGIPAIEAGAQDVEPDGDGGFRFFTEPTDLDTVSKALSTRRWTVATMRLGWRAKNPTRLEDPAARAEVEEFLASIDEDDDVQHIYVGYI